MVEFTGINLVGYASASIGLGTSVRAMARALLAKGHAVSIHDLQASDGRSGSDNSLAAHFVEDLDDLPHPVTIWIIGADVLFVMANKILDSPKLANAFNVAFVWWELPDVSPVCSTAAKVFDALITGSEFVREIFAMAVPGVPVLLAHHPLDVPPGVQADRKRFGLDPEAVIFYTGFEPASDPIRKNPFAAVQAFQRAFPGPSNAQLIIKVNNPKVGDRGTELLERLYAMVEGDTRIRLLRERLSYENLLCLYASVDMTVSLHRSEGLGLMPLEAMRFGVVPIATGWSGNMTYMTYAGAGLVRFEMVATDEGCAHYSPSNVGVWSRWAEPDVDDAASWMRLLTENPDMRRQMSQRARDDAIQYQTKGHSMAFLDELQVLWQRRAYAKARNHDELRNAINAARVEYKIGYERNWALRKLKLGRLSLEWRLQRHRLTARDPAAPDPW